MIKESSRPFSNIQTGTRKGFKNSDNAQVQIAKAPERILKRDNLAKFKRKQFTPLFAYSCC